MVLRITTPSKQWQDLRVEAVFFPGAEGSFEVLRGHAPIISALTKGRVRWDGGEGLDIESGYVQVENDVITVVVE